MYSLRQSFCMSLLMGVFVLNCTGLVCIYAVGKVSELVNTLSVKSKQTNNAEEIQEKRDNVFRQR